MKVPLLSGGRRRAKWAVAGVVALGVAVGIQVPGHADEVPDTRLPLYVTDSAAGQPHGVKIFRELTHEEQEKNVDPQVKRPNGDGCYVVPGKQEGQDTRVDTEFKANVGERFTVEEYQGSTCEGERESVGRVTVRKDQRTGADGKPQDIGVLDFQNRDRHLMIAPPKGAASYMFDTTCMDIEPLKPREEGRPPSFGTSWEVHRGDKVNLNFYPEKNCPSPKGFAFSFEVGPETLSKDDSLAYADFSGKDIKEGQPGR